MDDHLLICSSSSRGSPASLARSWEPLRVDSSWVTILLLWSVDSSILQEQLPAQLLILKLPPSGQSNMLLTTGGRENQLGGPN